MAKLVGRRAANFGFIAVVPTTNRVDIVRQGLRPMLDPAQPLPAWAAAALMRAETAHRARHALPEPDSDSDYDSGDEGVDMVNIAGELPNGVLA